MAILSYLAQSAFHRGKTLGVLRAVLGSEPNFHPAATDLAVIPNTINCEDLHVHDGLIFAACVDKDGTRAGWFPPIAHFDDPAQGNFGNLRVIDPEVSGWAPVAAFACCPWRRAALGARSKLMFPRP